MSCNAWSWGEGWLADRLLHRFINRPVEDHTVDHGATTTRRRMKVLMWDTS